MKLLLTLSLFSLLACQPVEEQIYSENTASAYGDQAAPSAWRSTSLFPLKMKLGSNLTDDEKTAITNAANAWEDGTSNKYNFFEFTDSSVDEKSNLDSYKDSEFGIYKTFSWPSDLPGTALAVTQIYGMKRNIGSSSEYIEITHADVLLNYDYFSFSTDDSWGYDLETVVLHELGHFLGLYHSDTSHETSVMYPTISRYIDNRAPKTADIEVLDKKYRNRTSSSRGTLANDSKSEPVQLIFELYPNKKEIIRIKKGDKYEVYHQHDHD